jgi:hypothetical protein
MQLLKRKNCFLQRRVDWFRYCCKAERVDCIYGVEKRAHAIIERGEDAHREGTDQQRQRVHDPNGLKCEERGCNDPYQDIIFYPVQVARFSIRFWLSERADDIVQSPERADPSTEYPAKKERKNDGDKRKIKCFCRGMGRQQCGDENERIEIKKETHGIPEFIVPFGLGLDEQKKEQEQEQPLNKPACILDSEEAHELFLCHVACHDTAVLRQVPRLAFTFFCNIHRPMHDCRNRHNIVLNPVNDPVFMEKYFSQIAALKLRDDPADLRKGADLFNRSVTLAVVIGRKDMFKVLQKRFYCQGDVHITAAFERKYMCGVPNEWKMNLQGSYDLELVLNDVVALQVFGVQ